MGKVRYYAAIVTSGFMQTTESKKVVELDIEPTFIHLEKGNKLKPQPTSKEREQPERV